MPDRLFSDPNLAALYDLFSPSEKRGDFEFYLPMLMAAKSVLDIGCGTGALLHMARDAGHSGRLCGIDPAEGMLEQARKRTFRPGIEWVLGDITTASMKREFDLVVMSGHAFQVFVSDDELRAALASICSALSENGRFAFETRNPPDRAWERWSTEYSNRVTDETGATVQLVCAVEESPQGDNPEGIVRFSHTFSSAGWQEPLVSNSTLRFLSAKSLSTFLANAGFEVEQQFGNWDRSPLTDISPEIITVARRVAD